MKCGFALKGFFTLLLLLNGGIVNEPGISESNLSGFIFWENSQDRRNG